MVAERAPLLTGCEHITVPRPLSHFGSDGTYLWGSLSGPGRRSQCRGVLAGVHHRWSVLEPFWLGPPRVWTYHCPWLVPSGYPTSCVPSVTRTRAHRWVSNGKNPLTAPCGSTNVCSARSTPSWARGAYAGRIPSRCTWGTFCFLQGCEHITFPSPMYAVLARPPPGHEVHSRQNSLTLYVGHLLFFARV